METTPIELTRRHASVRRYTADAVPRQTIEAIISGGQHASHSCDLQMYSVVAVTGREERERLVGLCDRQTFAAEFPGFLAWCADWGRLDRVCELRGYSQVTCYVEHFLMGAILE